MSDLSYLESYLWKWDNLFSSTNVLIPQFGKILKQISRKRGVHFLFQERIESFILPNQSPSADIHIHIYEHFPETLSCNTFSEYQLNGIYLQKIIHYLILNLFAVMTGFSFLLKLQEWKITTKLQDIFSVGDSAI